LLIRNERNAGFVKAANQGMAVSDAPYVCLMNNDTVATEGWLDEMVSVMRARPDIGVINPSSNTSGQFPGGMTIDDYALSLKALRGQVQELYTCRGFCMLVRRAVIDRVGLLDEAYSVGYFEENDYCRRALKAGFASARAKGAYVYHKESVSFSALGDKDEIFKGNEKIFLGRWGRSVRVGFLLNGELPAGRVDDIAAGVARSGHQITVFTKTGLEWPVGVDHFDIRRVGVSRIFFLPVSVYKVLKRRKKKPVEVLITDDPAVGALLRAVGPLHGADVLLRPSKDEVLELLERKSKQRIPA
jgi:hypothetical protein